MKNLSRASILLLALGMSYRTEAVEGATGAAAAPAVPPAPVPAPAAPAEAKPLTAAQQKKADAKAAKEKEKADKAAAAAATPKAEPKVADTKNNVTRPNSGKTKQVWDVADAMSKELKAPVDRKALTDKLLAEGLVVGTIHTQYGKWRKYHGLVTPKEAKPAAEAAPAATEAPAIPPAPAAV